MHDHISRNPIPGDDDAPKPQRATPIRIPPSAGAAGRNTAQAPSVPAVSAPLPVAATDNSARHGRGRPPSGKQAATKCIYFSDVNQLEQLEEIAKRYSTGSVSGIVQQLVEALLKSAAGQLRDARVIHIDTEIFL